MIIKRLGSRPFRLHLGAVTMVLTAGIVLAGSDEAERDRDLAARSAAAHDETSAPPVAATAAPAPTMPALDQIRRVAASNPIADAFAGRSWTPKPAPVKAPPPAPPPPPPVPVAPPLPFVYVGKWVEDGQAAVYYLERGPKVIAAAVGDQLDADYRLDSAAGGELTFVYLPLNARQAIRIGE